VAVALSIARGAADEPRLSEATTILSRWAVPYFLCAWGYEHYNMVINDL